MFNPIFQPASGPKEKQTKLNHADRRFEYEQLDFFIDLAGRHWRDSEISTEANKIIDLIKGRLC